MTPTQTCQRCGAELTESTCRGLCPGCLLLAGLADPAESSAEEKPALPSDPEGAEFEGLTWVPDPSSPAGNVSFGDYVLLERIARGGMGVVYKARQKSLDRIVALKLLLFGPQASPEFVQRFRAEAVAAASLQHPNIVAIHEVGVHQNQQFFVMDYVAGPTLAQLVAAQPLSSQRAARYLKTIAEAIHYAHERGILHRDLKPSNVLIDAEDQPRVTDFGLARRFEGESQMTLTGQVLGSPSYIPPEQALGQRGKVMRQTDVYALGATLHHLLTGRPPFQGETLPRTLHLVLNTEPVSPRLLNPGVPRDLETICLKCLEKEPARRYPTARELAEELGRFLEGQPIQARPTTSTGKLWKWCRRRPALAGMGTALVLTVALGLTGVVWEWRRAERTAAAELRQRLRAEAGEYAADMHLAQLALESDNRGLAVSLLEKHRPTGPSTAGSGHWEWRYLWQLTRGDESFTLHRYPREIRDLAVSKDGRLLAVMTWDGVSLWDLSTRRPLTGLPEGAIPPLALSSDGKFMAFGTGATTRPPAMSVWDVDAGRSVGTFPHDNPVRSAALSPDGRRLATFESRGKVQVVDRVSGQTLTNFSVPPPRYGTAGVVAFSPDGDSLAVGEGYGRLRLLDLRRGTSLTFPTENNGSINTLALSPKGELLAAALGYGGGTIRLWDARSGKFRSEFTNHTGQVASLAFTPDAEQLISASQDGTLRIWSVAQSAELRCLRSSGEALMALALLPESRTLVTGDSKGSICFWDLAVSRPTTSHSQLTLTPGFESFLAVDTPGFQSETLDPRAVRRGGLTFTPDGRDFLALDAAGSLALRETHSNRLLEQLSGLGSNHWGTAISPDGRWLATGDCPGRVTVWDWPARRAVTHFAVPFEWYGWLSFTPSGHHLMARVVLNDISIRIRTWRTADWAEVPLPETLLDGIWSLDLSPDEKSLAAGYRRGAVKLFRFPPAEPIATFTNHTAGVNTVLFLPDGRRLVSSSLDGSARLWDIVERTELATFRGHQGPTLGAARSPDGRRFITGGCSAADAVKLWDPAAGRALLTLQGEGQFFFDLGFSQDGNTLAATALSGTAHLWHAPSWAEIETAEKASMVTE